MRRWSSAKGRQHCRASSKKVAAVTRQHDERHGRTTTTMTTMTTTMFAQFPRRFLKKIVGAFDLKEPIDLPPSHGIAMLWIVTGITNGITLPRVLLDLSKKWYFWRSLQIFRFISTFIFDYPRLFFNFNSRRSAYRTWKFFCVWNSLQKFVLFSKCSSTRFGANCFQVCYHCLYVL